MNPIAILALAVTQALPPGTRIDTIARGLTHPWGVAFARDGRVFISERTGSIRVVVDGRLRAEPWAYIDVAQAGAGLLGLALHPDFPLDPRVYVMGSFTTARDNIFVNRLIVVRDSSGNSARRHVLRDDLPGARAHAGSAMAFGPDRMLYFTLGDAFQPGLVQDTGSLNGKILRIDADGRAAADNPFAGSAVWAFGLRNVQGLAWNDAGDLFATEHGPSNWPWEGGRRDHDELNHIVRGGNYGWPVVVGRASDTRFIDPLSVWTPAIAPSGIAWYNGAYAPWRSSLLIGALRGMHLRRVQLERAGNTWRVVAEELYSLGEGVRIRGVFIGPDGDPYVTTDRRRTAAGASDDLLLRIVLPRSPPGTEFR